jgi:hypothetical protein
MDDGAVKTAKPCNNPMGKILADAAALLEHLLERCRDHGGLRIVFEIAADAVYQVDRAARSPSPAPAGKFSSR